LEIIYAIINLGNYRIMISIIPIHEVNNRSSTTMITPNLNHPQIIGKTSLSAGLQLVRSVLHASNEIFSAGTEATTEVLGHK
jgi:hypothetical protein